jgi:hypothetical protein
VGDRVAARAARVLHGQLRDQRPPERGEQRISVPVVGVGANGREDELAGELLARVDHVAVERAEPQRLAPHDLVVLARLPEVHRERDDLRLVLVLDPLEHHARVQAARVEQQHPRDLVAQGEIRGHARGLRIGDAMDFGRWIARLVGHRQARVPPRLSRRAGA